MFFAAPGLRAGEASAAGTVTTAARSFFAGRADFPANVFIDRIYCNGVAAIAGPASGLPGNGRSTGLAARTECGFPSHSDAGLLANAARSATYSECAGNE